MLLHRGACLTKESVEDVGSKLDSNSSGFSLDGNSDRGTGDTFKRQIRLYKPVSTVWKYKYSSKLEY